MDSVPTVQAVSKMLAPLSMPPELLLCVCSFLSEDAATGDKAAKTALSRIARCSASAFNVAAPTLYRQLIITGDNFESVFAGMLPPLSDASKAAADGAASSSRKLKCLKSVEHIVLDGLPDWKRSKLLLHIRKTTSKAKAAGGIALSEALFPRLKTVSVTAHTSLALEIGDLKNSRRERGLHDPVFVHPFIRLLGCEPLSHLCVTFYTMDQMYDYVYDQRYTRKPANVLDTDDVSAMLKAAERERLGITLSASDELKMVTQELLDEYSKAIGEPTCYWLTALSAHAPLSSVTLHDLSLNSRIPAIRTELLRIFAVDKVCSAHGPSGDGSCDSLECKHNDSEYWVMTGELVADTALLETLRPKVVEVANMCSSFCLKEGCHCSDELGRSVRAIKDRTRHYVGDAIKLEMPHWSDVTSCTCCRIRVPAGADRKEPPAVQERSMVCTNGGIHNWFYSWTVGDEDEDDEEYYDDDDGDHDDQDEDGDHDGTNGQATEADARRLTDMLREADERRQQREGSAGSSLAGW